jgi:hypothetical protein
MKFSRAFYRTAAICSFVSAITTLGLIFLPRFYGPAASVDERVLRLDNPFYQLRAWTYLFHPFLTVTAALGVAVALRRRAAGLIVPGFLGFLLWGFTEAGQQTLTLAAFHRWARAWPEADSATREILRAHIATYDALWDAMFLLLLLGFFIANVLYGLATVRERGLTRMLGYFYFGAAFLTLAIFSGEVGGPSLPPLLEAWLYPLLQPAARALIGVWLWRAMDRSESPTHSFATTFHR